MGTNKQLYVIWDGEENGIKYEKIFHPFTGSSQCGAINCYMSFFHGSNALTTVNKHYINYSSIIMLIYGFHS